MLVKSTPPKIPPPEAVFWGLQNPYTKIREFSMGVPYGTWSKLVQDKRLKGRIVLVTEKTGVGDVWQNPWATPPNLFCKCRLWSQSHTFRFHPNTFRFGEVITYNQKTLLQPPK